MLKINKNILKGSLILIITFNIFNALNFLYHLIMARLLTVSEYGTLTALLAIVYITGLFIESIQTVVTKSVSSNQSNGKSKDIFLRVFRKSLFIAIIVLAAYSLVSIPLSNLLNIPYHLMLLNGLMLFISFLIPVSRGTLQGKKKFALLGINMISEGVTKIALAIFFIFLGWRIYGAMFAMILGIFFSFFLSILFIKDVLFSKRKSAHLEKESLQVRPIFILVSAVFFFYSLDVLIAKMVFTPDFAGYYSIASILAKTLFFATHPITKAMFPISVEDLRNSKKKKNSNVFLSTLAIFIVVLLSALLVIFLFPSFIIHIFSGKVLPESAEILPYISLAMGILSLSNLIIFYKVSRNRIKNYKYFLAILPIEAILLFAFSSTLKSFSIAFITSSVIFLIASILLLGNEKPHNNTRLQ